MRVKIHDYVERLTSCRTALGRPLFGTGETVVIDKKEPKPLTLTTCRVTDCFVVERVTLRLFKRDISHNEESAKTRLEQLGQQHWNPVECPKVLKFIVNFFKFAYENKIEVFEACCVFPRFLDQADRLEAEEILRTTLADFSAIEYRILTAQLETHWGLNNNGVDLAAFEQRLNYGHVAFDICMKLARAIQPGNYGG